MFAQYIKRCIFVVWKISINKQTFKMAYIKIKDRNLKFEDVTIISEKGKVTKSVREDRVQGYISDFILFNGLKGKPYLIKENI